MCEKCGDRADRLARGASGPADERTGAAGGAAAVAGCGRDSVRGNGAREAGAGAGVGAGAGAGAAVSVRAAERDATVVTSPGEGCGDTVTRVVANAVPTCEVIPVTPAARADHVPVAVHARQTSLSLDHSTVTGASFVVTATTARSVTVSPTLSETVGSDGSSSATPPARRRDDTQ